MALFKRKDQDVQPALDLVPSLRSVVEAGGLRAEDLAIALPKERTGTPDVRTNVLIRDEEDKEATWTVNSLRELFRGNVVPPNLEKFPPEYTPYFFFIEKHVVALYHAIGDRTDQQMETAYAMLRRRPDGRSVGPEHDFVWQVCALTLAMYPLSQAQFEAIVGRLEQSTRSFAMRPVSRNYAGHLHHQFGCGGH